MSRIGDLVNTHVKKFIKNDPASLNQLALDLDKYAVDDQTCRQLAIELSGKAAKEKDAKPEYIVTYANLVYKSNGKAEALKILDEALLKMEEPESKDYQTLKALRNKIENS